MVIAALVAGSFDGSFLLAVGYIVAEVLGGIFGSALLLTLPPNAPSPQSIMPTTSPGFGISAAQAFGCEFLITFFLVTVPLKRSFPPLSQTFTSHPAQSFAVFAISKQPALAKHFPGLIGAVCQPQPLFCPSQSHALVQVVGGNVLAAAFISGGSMNPARSLGPELVQGFTESKSSSHWVYWAGPILGASLAALIEKHFLFPPLNAQEKEALRRHHASQIEQSIRNN